MSVGWIKVYIFKQRRYYYNPSRPEGLIAELVPKILRVRKDKLIE